MRTVSHTGRASHPAGSACASARDLGKVIATQPERGLAERKVGGIEVARDERVELGLAEHDRPRARATPREIEDLLLRPHAVVRGKSNGLDDRRLEQANDRPAPGDGQHADRHESPDRGEAPPAPEPHGSNSTIATS